MISSHCLQLAKQYKSAIGPKTAIPLLPPVQQRESLGYSVVVYLPVTSEIHISMDYLIAA